MIGVGPGWEGTYGEPPLRPVNRRLAPTQVRILVLPPPRRPADTWSPSGPGRATRRARLRSDVAPADALLTRCGRGGPWWRPSRVADRRPLGGRSGGCRGWDRSRPGERIVQDRRPRLGGLRGSAGSARRLVRACGLEVPYRDLGCGGTPSSSLTAGSGGSSADCLHRGSPRIRQRGRRGCRRRLRGVGRGGRRTLSSSTRTIVAAPVPARDAWSVVGDLAAWWMPCRRGPAQVPAARGLGASGIASPRGPVRGVGRRVRLARNCSVGEAACSCPLPLGGLGLAWGLLLLGGRLRRRGRRRPRSVRPPVGRSGGAGGCRRAGPARRRRRGEAGRR